MKRDRRAGSERETVDLSVNTKTCVFKSVRRDLSIPFIIQET